MYRMKNIVSFVDNEVILPECMYSIKKITEPQIADAMEINISNQVITFLKQAPVTKMTELEERQNLLLKKLDILYDRIKTISSFCQLNKTNCSSTPVVQPKKEHNIVSNVTMDEIVVVLSPDSLPWFLNIYLKQVKDINISWHIHSSVPNEKKSKIYAFFKKFAYLYPGGKKRINIRLIFKCVGFDSELKMSCIEIPMVGIVNVMRYLALVYPNIVVYDSNDYQVDSLLDLCCILERASEKNKETSIKKLFSQQNQWIYGNSFSIVDLAVYNTVKQWQNSTKYVPKSWFEKCEKLVI